MDQCIRRARPTLTSPICMRKNFRRGRPPLCPTTTERVVASIKPMVGWDTVTDICRDRGRFSGEPSFVFLGAMRVQQSATAVCAAIRKSDVMTQASQWPRRRHAHSSMSLRSISTDAAGFAYHSMSAHARKRPDYCAATRCRDGPITEVGGRHSITSLARPRSGNGSVMPRALALFVLMISSTMVTCWTGRSLAFSPLRIRPV